MNLCGAVLFCGISRSDGLVFHHLVLWCAAGASDFSVVCRRGPLDPLGFLITY